MCCGGEAVSAGRGTVTVEEGPRSHLTRLHPLPSNLRSMVTELHLQDTETRKRAMKLALSAGENWGPAQGAGFGVLRHEHTSMPPSALLRNQLLYSNFPPGPNLD